MSHKDGLDPNLVPDTEDQAEPEFPVIVRRPKPAGGAGGSLNLAVGQWPPLIVRAGPAAEERFLEFFAATIRNKNTRMAYFRAISRFVKWADERHLELEDIRPIQTASYIEGFTVGLSDLSVKQHLAAIKMLFDWLVTGQIVPFNPASAVRGPKHVVKKGKTPVRTAEEEPVAGFHSQRNGGGIAGLGAHRHYALQLRPRVRSG